MDGNSSTCLHSLLKNTLAFFVSMWTQKHTTEETCWGKKKTSHGTCRVDVKAAAISDWRTVAWCISSFKCPECVQQSLSDWTHVFHRDESAPFSLVTSASLCPVKVTSDAIARGERLSPLCTHSRLSCDHICGGLCGRAHKWVYDKLKVLRAFLCVCPLAFVCHSMSTWTYGLKGMETGPQISEAGSTSRVKVSTVAYWAILLSRCHSLDVKKNTSFYPPTLKDKHRTSFLSCWNKRQNDEDQTPI